MLLVSLVRRGRWPTPVGYVLFIGMMAVGYCYNVTFIQLGLTDLGSRVLGLSEDKVAGHLAALAIGTALVALLTGWQMARKPWGRDFVTKLRVACLVILMQTVLTGLAPAVHRETVFMLWLSLASVALGLGVPITFSLTADLIRVTDRGYVAAAITALAYLAALAPPPHWQIEQFSRQCLWVMLPGTAGLAVFSFGPWPFLRGLAAQHLRPEFGRGRFVTSAGLDGRQNRRVAGLALLMFGVYFIDSLGFLRLSETPIYAVTAWRAEELQTRLLIAGVHALAAAAAGIVYASFGSRQLFLWTFGVFALAQWSYGFHAQVAGGSLAPLGMPMLYAVAVSVYTVLNFTLWADIATPGTIGLYSAWGVGLSGWAASFLSTALALRLRAQGVPLARHLGLVDALAILLFLVLAYRVLTAHEAGKSLAR